MKLWHQSDVPDIVREVKRSESFDAANENSAMAYPEIQVRTMKI